MDEQSREEIICYCAGVTRGDILDALEQGAKSLADVRRMTGACTQGNCQELSPRKTCCAPLIRDIIIAYKLAHR